MTEKKRPQVTNKTFATDSHVPKATEIKSYRPTSRPQGNHTPTSQGGPKSPPPAPKKK